MKVVFLVEEPSMATLLNAWIPREFPDLDFQCVPHEGKSDLKKSIPRKLKGWREPDIVFIILIDNDNKDCQSLKEELAAICVAAGRNDAIIRIVCQELEAWYFGDPEAVDRAYPGNRVREKFGAKKYRNPDEIQKPSVEISRIIPEFQKLSGARRIGAFFTAAQNRSKSLAVTFDKISSLL